MLENQKDNNFISIFSALKYDNSSIARLQNFLEQCKSALSPGSSIWAAISLNNLNDVGGGYPTQWKSTVDQTKRNLEKQGYTCTLLPINFRNSNDIRE